ncbi:MAG: GTPase ObgE [Clostridia bacterium]|nr:GTPase ObgE [Clostridia bacterium]
MFVDKERISLKSGDGGNGAVSFIRYKGVANGGPDGGDGGRGGHIYFVGDRHKTTLIDFHFKHKYVAENGGKGDSGKCHGKNGEDLYIKVPLGTVVRDAETEKIICDIYYDGQTHLVLEGGNGGKGNVHFCTSRRHAPHFSQTGEKTELRRVILELKTIADVGLIGFPNVGKSTVLSKVSGAKPKIANYHFTTMSPNLGVVGFYDDSFVCADIPGLIEGAADGAGLGIEFLRHIERTRILVHVVDVSGSEGRDPYEDYKQINAELKNYSKELAKRPQLILLNKSDCYGAEENIKIFKRKINGRKKIFISSAIKGEGLEDLVKTIVAMLKEMPAPTPIPHEEFKYEKVDVRKFEIIKNEEDNVFIVDGPIVKLLERNVVLNDPDSLAYMQKTLKTYGVITALRNAGCKDGDTVVIGEIEFDFVD